MADDLFTEDTLLGDRVRLRQPKSGFRTAIDAVLLAAAVPARANDRVLDLGTGTGAVALCLAHRVAGVSVVGLEADPQTADLATANVEANGLSACVSMVQGDVLAPPADLCRDPFDHAAANPPHLVAGRARASSEPGRARSTMEGEADLLAWVTAARRLVRRHGTLTLVHRADRLDSVLNAMSTACGDVTLFPLWPSANGRAAKRILVSGRIGTRGPVRLLPGLVLHRGQGGYTREGDAVLRDGAALDLWGSA